MALWSNAKLLTTLCQRGVLTFSLCLRVVRGGYCPCKIPGFQRYDWGHACAARGSSLGSSSSSYHEVALSVALSESAFAYCELGYLSIRIQISQTNIDKSIVPLVPLI